ncbi:MAG: hypothetical protein J0L75_17245 [Spirochaetes bacterium]|nr:hypothetical protein [Spirochaetota bacterium]
MKGKRSAQITLLLAGAAAVVAAGCQQTQAPRAWKTESDCVAETGSATNCAYNPSTGRYHGMGIWALPYLGRSSFFGGSRGGSWFRGSSSTGSPSSAGSVTRGGFGSTGSHLSSGSSS